MNQDSISKNKLSKSVIEEAINGDEIALKTILTFYERYISSCCMRTYYDESGNPHRYVDEEMKATIESKLLEKILKFQLQY